MKSALFEGTGKLSIVDTEIGDPGLGEVLVKVKATGICGTDHHIFKGDAPAEPPVILGHEIAGQVVKVGSDVKGITPGDMVAVDPNIYCGECFHCRRGEINLCQNLKAVGVTRNGGFAEFVLAPTTNVYKLSSEISYEEGAMVEPVSCCLHGIDIAGIEAGDLVVVLGGGAIGLILAQLAMVGGARQVIISEPDESKREIASELGFDRVVTPSDVKETVTNISKAGADVVIEAVGIEATVAQTFELVRRGGTILFFGVCPQNLKVPMSPFDIYKRELTVKGSYINPFVTERAIDILLDKKINVKPLITDRYELEDLPKVLGKEETGSVKSLVVFE